MAVTVAKDGPGGEKTEKPTPQRLKKARKEGQIPRTQELGTWLGVAAASVLLPMLVSNAFDAVQKMFVQVGAVATHPETEALSALMGQALTAFLTTVLPMARGDDGGRHRRRRGAGRRHGLDQVDEADAEEAQPVPRASSGCSAPRASGRRSRR